MHMKNDTVVLYVDMTKCLFLGILSGCLFAWMSVSHLWEIKNKRWNN